MMLSSSYHVLLRRINQLCMQYPYIDFVIHRIISLFIIRFLWKKITVENIHYVYHALAKTIKLHMFEYHADKDELPPAQLSFYRLDQIE